MVLDTVLKVEDKSLRLEDLTPKTKETTPLAKEPTPKTYTEEEFVEGIEKSVHAALMKAGRDWKSVELERDNLTNLLKDTKTANDKLTLQIDELVSENPDKFNVVKKSRELDERETVLNKGLQTLEVEKQSQQDSIKLANETLREIAVWDIAEEFEGGNAEMLKTLADTLNAKTEDVRKVAETLWKLKQRTPETAELKLDSSVTLGGLSEQTIRENYRNNPNDPRAREEYLAWRRKKGI